MIYIIENRKYAKVLPKAILRTSCRKSIIVRHDQFLFPSATNKVFVLDQEDVQQEPATRALRRRSKRPLSQGNVT